MIDAVVKLAHVLSGAVLFGTGLGIAFFMVWATRSRSARTVADVGRIVVVADFLFTATAVVVQPLSGLWLIHAQGWSLTEPWLLATYVLYGFTGLCWLPVVWIQMRMARLAEAASEAGEDLPPGYDRLYWIWFALGWPAFAAVIGIYILMLFKPAL
ncbi:DUF2269 family protein [Brevundimonas sp. Root1279]|uniref:DUF2269 family protein n=1 Tax=Brevundimonas sp. Root1279 TaxID=1736443 RepID=UPI0006F244F7|nr:DUF2269 domain-containing protein [Brevundimonas sp. Root1279]KQW83216.1 hypothetical protein ASC65_07795 [Brevundimonas sp. Root1279]